MAHSSTAQALFRLIFGWFIRKKLRRETVEKEAIYVVLGVNEEGYREILDFFVGGQESAYVWQEILQHLYKKRRQGSASWRLRWPSGAGGSL